MSECKDGSCSVEQNNSASCTTDECCDMPAQLLCLADEAWRELVKDKLKAAIEESCGEKLDELAKLVSEANAYRWQHKIEAKTKCEEYKSNVRTFFTDCGCDEDKK